MVDLIKKTTKSVQENLFSSVGSSVLTIATTYVVINFFRGMLGFALTSDKDWLAVLNNMQLYMVQAYPEEDFIRVWLSVGLTFVLAGLSIGIWRSEERVKSSQIFNSFFKGGLGVLFFTIIAPTNASFMGNDGSVITEEVLSMDTRLGILIPVIIFCAIFFSIRFTNLNFTVNSSDMVFFYLFLPVALIWFVKLPTIQLDQNNERIIPEPLMPIANSTKIPWTVIFVAFLVSYFIGMYIKNIKSIKSIMSLSWFLLPLLIFSWIFKKPQIEMSVVLGSDLPIFGFFLIWGFLVITFVNNTLFKKYYSTYLGITFLLTIAGVFSGLPMLAKTCLLLITLFSVSLTWLLAIFGTYVSFPLGVLLALGRNSKLPIIRIVCTGIIELTRSVPYITWLFFASVTLAVFLPAGVEFNLIVRVLMVTAFFSGAYFAENIRGGLQSIPKGQYEAADAIGMSPFQKISLIIMPQALRAVIPTLVSSAITAFKDSSLVTIIGLFDFLTIGKTVIGNQSIPVNFVGHDRENLIFVAIVYWIFTFTLSRRSMKVEKKLGLGER